jgi:hypothetical protein
MGVAVGVGDGVAVAVGVSDEIAVGSGNWTGSWATEVAASMEGGGSVGTAVAKPVGARVGSGGKDTAVSRPQPVSPNSPAKIISQMAASIFIAGELYQTRLVIDRFPAIRIIFCIKLKMPNIIQEK